MKIKKANNDLESACITLSTDKEKNIIFIILK
jgi:hypothetical protein